MYLKWEKSPVRFIALTGYSLEQFEELLPYFKSAHQNYFEKHDLDGKRRKQLRAHVVYANSPLPTIEDRLVFILSFQKLNPIQEQHAAMFEMQQKQCNRFIHTLTQVLSLALEDACVMPATTEKELEKEMEGENFTGYLLHDGTEREIPRPQDEELQAKNYSGKKKKHTVKNGLIVSSVCYILFVSATVSGAMHDKKIADQYYHDALNNNKKVALLQDTGYQGFQPKGVTIIQPQKKPKGRDLTKEEKQYNRSVSSVRIRVEHAIGSTKRYRIVKDECRLRKDDYPGKIFRICAALHNFRIQMKPFNYPEIKLT